MFGVDAELVGGDLMVTVFLIGELWRVPDGLLCLFDALSEEGRDVVLLREGVGVARAEVGALDVRLGVCLILC